MAYFPVLLSTSPTNIRWIQPPRGCLITRLRTSVRLSVRRCTRARSETQMHAIVMSTGAEQRCGPIAFTRLCVISFDRAASANSDQIHLRLSVDLYYVRISVSNIKVSINLNVCLHWPQLLVGFATYVVHHNITTSDDLFTGRIRRNCEYYRIEDTLAMVIRHSQRTKRMTMSSCLAAELR